MPVPNLDDREFEQLVTEARALIPRNFPEWTDHNTSDPGITLLELFAYFIESSIYQLNRVPERSLEHFAGLVGISRIAGESIEQTLRLALEAVALKYRAVTEEEFERIAKQTPRVTHSGGEFSETVARAKAVVRVVATPNVFPDEQFIDVIVVPDIEAPAPMPSPELLEAVFETLQPRRLITTRVRALPPTYTPVRISVTVARDRLNRLDRQAVSENIERAVSTFLSPLRGGVSGQGWEFGRPVFRSELYQLIEGVAGVDSVRQLLLNGDELIGEFPLAPQNSPARLTSLAQLDALEVNVLNLD
ncbi:MAG: baseplate J/gp47 family protein [Acidobacteria bacterium]|nr:baseplate J/gp47 family protein [Acidobacteriota bacterium]